ncbi:MAG: hypothetical protein LIP04_11165 [Tannerellaceae bacterium]|nr:hypothetical protein [Tannerellaceae bacterium]
MYQLNDPGLEQGVHLLSPSESPFMHAYIQFLLSRYKQPEKPGMPETTYRHTIWQIVYAYMLTTRSSWFNKKNICQVYHNPFSLCDQHHLLRITGYIDR